MTAMKESITAKIDGNLDLIIEAVAEHHDISKSRTIELLLREGVNAREMRYRLEQMDAKIDILIESLGGEPIAREAVEERFETVTERGLPEAVAGVDLANEPLPFFRSTGDYPDRSREEESLKDALASEREAISGLGGEAEQGADD